MKGVAVGFFLVTMLTPAIAGSTLASPLPPQAATIFVNSAGGD